MRNLKIISITFVTLILMFVLNDRMPIKKSSNLKNTPQTKQAETNKQSALEKSQNSTPASNSQSIAVVSALSNIDVLVNKKNMLPYNWKPDDLVEVSVPYCGREDAKYMRKDASIALSKLFKKAKSEDIELCAVSGFRSYELQKSVFAYQVSRLGDAKARKISAYPGHSEHQTGLAMDISTAAMNYSLDESFGSSQEGKWLKKHAAEFGFIIRYPKGKEAITGYSYEPWHIRYVGETAAKEIMKKNITLEEYLGL